MIGQLALSVAGGVLERRFQRLPQPGLLARPASLTGPQQAQAEPWLAVSPPALVPARPGAATSARAAVPPQVGQAAGSSRRAIGRNSEKSPQLVQR